MQISLCVCVLVVHLERMGLFAGWFFIVGAL